MKNPIFWHITPCKPIEVTNISGKHVTAIFKVEEEAGSKQGYVATCFILVSCLAYSSHLKMEIRS
jgi:hypothetical protein